MARPKPDPVLTRNKILDAAESMMGTRGFSDLTMKLVAAEADMAVGKIYKFFPDKASLFIHLECRFSQSLAQLIDHVLSQPNKPQAQFRQVLKAVFNFYRDNLGLVKMSVDPPYIHSDFIGTELESVANDELAATMKVRLTVRNILKEILADGHKLPESVLDQHVLLLINQITGLLLNSQSRNLSYMLGAESISTEEASAVIDAQLNLIADLVISPSLP